MGILGDLTNSFTSETQKFLYGDNSNQNFNINEYKSKFMGANARAYLFVCNVNFPGMQNALSSGIKSGLAGGFLAGLTTTANTLIGNAGLSVGTEDFKYFVKTTSLPETSIEESSTFFAGQQYKMSSVRRTSDWSVTFLVDNKADVVKKFWQWHLLMHNPESNIYGSPRDYMTDQTVQLLGLDGNPTATYKLFSAWPKTIGEVQLDYGSNDFATVDITFAYQYHTVQQEAETGLMETTRQAVRSGGVAGLKNLIFK